MTEPQEYKLHIQQVTFREFCSADLHPYRLNHICVRLHHSLIQQLGRFPTDRTSDWIAQAFLQLLQKLQRTRALAESDDPVFPYLQKTALRIAFEELSPEPRSSYERTRRVECTPEDLENALLDLQNVTTPEFNSAYSVADDYQEAWRKLPYNQRFVLEAVAMAKINGYELNNRDLGIELGAILGRKPIKGNTIAQYKTRAIRKIREAMVPSTTALRTEDGKTE